MNNIEVERVILFDEIKNDTLDINNSKAILNIDKEFKHLNININENSSLILNLKYENIKLNEQLTINLNGESSKLLLNLNTLTDIDEKFIININHNNKKTISKVINHGVVLNSSKLFFIVNSKVVKGAIKSVIEEECKIIVLGKNNSEIHPNMYIDEYDVDAIHSATIGKFNKDEIFYLMSKGISYDKCLELLINGFLGGNYERK